MAPATLTVHLQGPFDWSQSPDCLLSRVPGAHQSTRRGQNAGCRNQRIIRILGYALYVALCFKEELYDLLSNALNCRSYSPTSFMTLVRLSKNRSKEPCSTLYFVPSLNLLHSCAYFSEYRRSMTPQDLCPYY
jgi:hypothetical protein